MVGNFGLNLDTDKAIHF